MNDLNVIKTINNSNCTIYVCDNEIGTEEEQKQCWQEFCKIAYKILDRKENQKMEQAKFIKKENDLAEYEIDETNKNAKGVSEKVYKAEKIERRGEGGRDK